MFQKRNGRSSYHGLMNKRMLNVFIFRFNRYNLYENIEKIWKFPNDGKKYIGIKVVDDPLLDLTIRIFSQYKQVVESNDNINDWYMYILYFRTIATV